MIPVKTKAHLLSMGLPSDAEMIRRVRLFVMNAGLTIAEMADMAAVNPNSLRVYLSGSYGLKSPADSNTLPIRAALKQALDLNEVKHTSPAEEKLYTSVEYETIRKAMLRALHAHTGVLVDGPSGSKKSWSFRRVCHEINDGHLGRAIYVYCQMDQTPQSFLVEACTEAGLPNRGYIGQLLRKLRYFLAGEHALLVVDEAQHLPKETLEIVRQLLDDGPNHEPHFGVVLAGSHDISQCLAKWNMEQWRSRLRRTLLLNGPSYEEAAQILTGELGPLPNDIIKGTIADATVEAVRDHKAFKYISVRNLFFAIEDARASVEEAIEKEAIA